MPRANRKAKTKGPKESLEPPNGAAPEAEAEVAIAEPPSHEQSQSGAGVETADMTQAEEPSPVARKRERSAQKSGDSTTSGPEQKTSSTDKGAEDKDHIAATSLNIAKL